MGTTLQQEWSKTTDKVSFTEFPAIVDIKKCVAIGTALRLQQHIDTFYTKKIIVYLRLLLKEIHTTWF